MIRILLYSSVSQSINFLSHSYRIMDHLHLILKRSNLEERLALKYKLFHFILNYLINYLIFMLIYYCNYENYLDFMCF